jgi:phosphate transport system protein
MPLMSLFLVREVEKLKKALLALSANVEENFSRALTAIERRDPDLAQRAIDRDAQIDLAEINVEEECLKILALHQPVAQDLRYIVACLKINNDLERIGDLAVGIARRCAPLVRLTEVAVPSDLRLMVDKAQAMLSKSLDALMNLDADRARQVLAADDEVDALRAQVYEELAAQLREAPDLVGPLMQLIFIARALERIADHATNIAEDVIYMLQGEIVRHNVEDALARTSPVA